MIAVDTNVLLRHLVQDDDRQSEIARQLLEDQFTDVSPGFVSIVAVLELDWVLRSQYQFPEKIVAEVLMALMASPNLVFEQSSAVRTALDFTYGDLADNILHQLSLVHGCTKTVTFDKKFARLAGVELLA